MAATELIRDTDFDAVRQVIDISLTSDDIPDRILRQPLYKDLAIAEVQRRVPGWADILLAGGADELYLRAAAQYLLAAALAPRIPQMVSEEEGTTYKYRRNAFDGQALAGLLRSQADDAIALIDVQYLTPTEDERRMPSFFTVAPGRRGSLTGRRPRGLPPSPGGTIP